MKHYIIIISFILTVSLVSATVCSNAVLTLNASRAGMPNLTTSIDLGVFGWMRNDTNTLINYYNKTDSNDLFNYTRILGTCSGTSVVQNLTSNGVQCYNPSTSDTWNTTDEMRSAVNVSAYYILKVNCSNIVGSPDSDFCTDTDTNTWNTTQQMITATGWTNSSGWSNTTNMVGMKYTSGTDMGVYIENSGTGASDSAAVYLKNPYFFSTLFTTTTAKSGIPNATGFYTSASNGFVVFPMGIEALRVKSTETYLYGQGETGEVGINTLLPNASLDIVGNAIISDNVTINTNLSVTGRTFMLNTVCLNSACTSNISYNGTHTIIS